ncbi:MAG: KpsF/GutQ family sugar-phosphate isomerase [Pirellulales bacterium]|nr:KpsF/GutQ family sugar-phosphate isomerase [Pirellulales bacterium]
MSTEAAATADAHSPFEQLRFARGVILAESQALIRVADRLDGEFCRAVQLFLECRGNVIVSGIGKAGLVGRKIMATLASTGTPSHCLHPAEAMHGDLGRVRAGDVALILSLSGETDEVVRLLPALKEIGAPVVAITGSASSTLGRAAAATIELGPMEEACALRLAPSTSTTAMLAVGDALALAVSRLRGFSREDFARFHPAGNLGFQLSKVDQHMRPLTQCRVAEDEQTVREVLIGATVPGRRSGAIMLVDNDGMLSGIFTDSDLARLFECHRDREMDLAIKRVMTRNPLRVESGSPMVDAVGLMSARKISELPVVNSRGRPLGMLDITDVVSMLPKDSAPTEFARFSSDKSVPLRVVGENEERQRA